MSELRRYFENNQRRLIYRWHHYFEIYEKHFERFRDKSPVVVEIGVYHGGSLKMWKHYFGNGSIYGIDIDERRRAFEEDGIKIVIGNQSNRAFLKKLKTEIPPIDILIDDGGHYSKQQIITLQELFRHIKDDGFYLCEDTQTSYMEAYDGGFRHEGDRPLGGRLNRSQRTSVGDRA